jgi:tetratricopeptide (TPR) repeat protein
MMHRCLVTLWCVAVAAQAQSDDVASQIRAGQRALEDWQLSSALKTTETLSRDHADVAAVQVLVGTVKFHQGDYDAAVQWLRRAAETSGDAPTLLSLAESTQQETAGFVSTESEHFIIRVPPGKDELLVPIAAEALEQSYAALSSAFGFQLDHKVAVDVLHDAAGLASVSTLTKQEIETSGTIALCKFNRLMITSPKALARGYSWLDTLSHELAHLIISEKSHNNVPIWLHEGLAKFNETRWRGEAGLALDPGSESLLADAVKKKALITFEQMHPSMAKLPSQRDTATAFAEVFTVIEFIERERSIDHPQAIPTLLALLGDNRSLDDALRAAVGTDLDGLQRVWRGYLGKRKYRLVPGAAAKRLTFVASARTGSADVDAQETALGERELSGPVASEAKKRWRLGNLLRERRRLGAASKEYELALSAIKTPSIALSNKLASIHIELGNLDRARAILDNSQAAFPDDPQLHILLGRVALRQQRWSDARRAYQRASWENPFHPEIHAALGQIGKELNDAPLTKRANHAMALLSGQAVSQPAAHRPLPAGQLSLDSDPWGKVFIDGEATPWFSPLVALPMRPGRHFVRVHDPVSGRLDGAWVTITADQHEQLRLTLRALDEAQTQQLLSNEQPQPSVAP